MLALGPLSLVQNRPFCPVVHQRQDARQICHARGPERATQQESSKHRKLDLTLASTATEQDTMDRSSESASTSGGLEFYQPGSYSELVSDASTAIDTAIEDGCRRMEVEFPPLNSTGTGIRVTANPWCWSGVSVF